MKKKFYSIVAFVLSIVFILSATPIALAASTTQRTSVPATSSDYYYSNSKNPFYTANLWTWCTWYAYGRAYEILDSKPSLSTKAAKNWFNDNKTKWDAGTGGYSYSTNYYAAKFGAIACYSNHVQVVEAVGADGSPSAISTGGHAGSTNSSAFLNKDGWTNHTRFHYGTDYEKNNFVGYIYILGGSDNSISTTPSIVVQAPAVTTNAAKDITGTTVYLSGTVSNPQKQKITQCGVVLTEKGQSPQEVGTDKNLSYTINPMNMWYDNIKVESGKEYSYYCYAIVGGTRYEGNVVTFNTGSAVCAKHEYDDLGICKNCGESFPLNPASISKTMITARTSGDNVPAHSSPYGAATITRRLEATGETVNIKAQATNAFGNLWYQTTSGDWIVYDYLADKPSDSNLTLSVSGASSITTSTVRLDASCSYTGTKPSSVGVYLGTSSGSMSKKDSDTINHTKNPFDIWYNLTGLSAGTTYYYKFYAIMDGKETTTSTYEFTTTAVTNNLTLSVSGASGITTSTVRLDASCSYTGTRPSSVGVYLGTSSGSMSKKDSDTINHNKNPFDIWYNLTGLSAGTTYYYKFYAIVDGKETVSDTKSFTTTAATAPVTFSSIGVRNITSTNAEPYCTISYTGTRPSEVGVYVGDGGIVSFGASDTINHNKNPFDAWYDINSELSYKLSPGTTYTYYFYAVIDGVKYTSTKMSFTTTK